MNSSPPSARLHPPPPVPTLGALRREPASLSELRHQYGSALATALRTRAALGARHIDNVTHSFARATASLIALLRGVWRLLTAPFLSTGRAGESYLPLYAVPVVGVTALTSWQLRAEMEDVLTQLLDLFDEYRHGCPCTLTSVWLRLGDLVQNESCHPSILNISSSEGYSALFYAALYRKPMMCRLLMARGADMPFGLRASSDRRLSVLLWCWVEMRRGWADKGACSRARTAEADIFRLLIAAGADSDATANGCPLLYWACFEGHAEVAEVLLAAPGERLGWETSGKVFVNSSPLLPAVVKGHFDVVQLLCREEFRPRVMVDDCRLSSLSQLAMGMGFDDIAEFVESICWETLV